MKLLATGIIALLVGAGAATAIEEHRISSRVSADELERCRSRAFTDADHLLSVVACVTASNEVYSIRQCVHRVEPDLNLP